MDDKNLEKKAGYLLQDFRLFHIQDQLSKEFEFHYHDFHKIIFFYPGMSPIRSKENLTI